MVPPLIGFAGIAIPSVSSFTGDDGVFKHECRCVIASLIGCLSGVVPNRQRKLWGASDEDGFAEGC